MPVGRPDKLTLLPAGVGACNYAADTPLWLHGQVTRDFAVPVKRLKAHRLFVSADLHDRVRGGVNDQVPLFDFLLRKLIQNRRSAGCLVADDMTARSLLQRLNQLLRETCFGEGDEGLLRIDSHHLPVPGHRVFAVRALLHGHEVTHRILNRSDALHRL